MSHSVNIKTQFKNINNLLSQFETLGWKITQNSKCRTYYSDPSKELVHQYVAVNPSSSGFDVGINVDDTGHAVFVCDFYDRSIETQLGVNLKKIKQNYALTELKKFMYEEDLSYKVEELDTGELVVIAEK
jgi:transposase